MLSFIHSCALCFVRVSINHYYYYYDLYPGLQTPTNHKWLMKQAVKRFVADTDAESRVVLDSFFREDSTLTHMTIQVTQLRLNSNPKFANLTQLRLNSKPNFTNLTQF